MSNEKNQKFPLTKKERSEFEDAYELIFMKRPVHNISDEKLVEIVNSNTEKLNANANSQSKPSSEGIQNESVENEQPNPGEGSDKGAEGGEDYEPGQLSEDAAKAQAEKEREYQFDQYLKLYGESPDGNLSTDEVTAANISQLNYNAAMMVYFDLFGKKPIPEMTTDQILNSIAVEQKRQEEIKLQAAEDKKTPESDLNHDPETEMIIVNKKDKNDKRVVKKGTFQFLKENYDAVVLEPKELQNFKK